MKKIIAIVVSASVLLLVAYVGLAVARIPHPYVLETPSQSYPLMTWEEYRKSDIDLSVPIVLEAEGSRSALLFFGADHSNDPDHPQFAELDAVFERFGPTVVLVEGRPGPLFPPFTNSIVSYGESGRLHQLALDAGARSYTWELTREDEARLLLERYSPDQVAIYLLMRPFPGGASAEEAEQNLAAIIEDRGHRPGIDGVIGDLEQFETAWRANVPTGEDWRDLVGLYDAPGFLGEMFEYGNDIRDQNLLNIVRELAEGGERVMVTMGSSHTVRVERAIDQLAESLE